MSNEKTIHDLTFIESSLSVAASAVRDMRTSLGQLDSAVDLTMQLEELKKATTSLDGTVDNANSAVADAVEKDATAKAEVVQAGNPDESADDDSGGEEEGTLLESVTGEEDSERSRG